MSSRLLHRRDFVASLAGAAAFGPRLRLARPPRADLVIRGGTVIDGTGAPGLELDVSVSGSRIAEVSAGVGSVGAVEIDARGLIVAPGFVDIHSHGDSSLDADPRAESLVRQGITSIVVGQDGGSASLPTSRAAVNVAFMVGLGSVRSEVVGLEDRPATGAELVRMVDLVEQGLNAGACGVSSGLEYTPGAFASRDELISLCRPVAARGLVYATHMRNEDDRLLDAVSEAIGIAAGAGCALHISHLKTQGPRNWGRLDDVFALVERAGSSGAGVTFDRYPYVAYQTGLTSLFPVWSRDGGFDRFLARLDDAALASLIRAETLAKVELIGGWHNVQITSVAVETDRGAEGARLDEWARARDEDPLAAAIGLLRRNAGSVGMVGYAMSESNLERILAHRQSMVASDGGAYAVDGPARRGVPHPRGLGTFPRVLGRYVRERGVLSLEQAVRKMTWMPASRIRLGDRGRMAPGLAADLVVFDPAMVADRATFADPFQYPAGIAAVIINGTVVLREGERARELPGVRLAPEPAGVR